VVERAAFEPSTKLTADLKQNLMQRFFNFKMLSLNLVKRTQQLTVPKGPACALVAFNRGMKTLDFGGHKEVVYERSDYPKDKLHKMFEKETFAVIGYGTQGKAQSLNMRDNGLNVIVGLRENGVSWKNAIKDGWVPNKTLFPINDACKKGSTIMNLLSDAGQKENWPELIKHLTKGKTLYFSHGFSVIFNKDTGVVPPKDIDVILVAPKGSGTTVRSLFLDGRGINSSVAVYQDVTGKAKEKVKLI
jgi:ketol-acid reductoisomerase